MYLFIYLTEWQTLLSGLWDAVWIRISATRLSRIQIQAMAVAPKQKLLVR
jgi:hypothetical protein